jgi:hypothetical protein
MNCVLVAAEGCCLPTGLAGALASLSFRLKPMFEEEARRRQVAGLRQGAEFPVGENSPRRGNVAENGKAAREHGRTDARCRFQRQGNGANEPLCYLSLLRFKDSDSRPLHRTHRPFRSGPCGLSCMLSQRFPKAITRATLFPEKYPKALMRPSPQTITSASSDPRLSDHALTVPCHSARSRGPLPR